MDTLQSLLYGFSVSLTPMNLLYCALGVLLGTLVGVLPGIGPLGGITLLLPTTFGMEPISAIIMLAGIYYGAMYGGSTTSILVNIPGEAASVVTCFDGYQMARQGRAGPALAIAAIGSYVAGTLSVLGLMFLAPVLAGIALQFGPPEQFSLMVLGLIILAYMGTGSVLKALIMIVLGLTLAMVGIDHLSGFTRFTHGRVELGDGISFLAVAMGLFGIAEILINLEQTVVPEVIKPKLATLLPSREDCRRSLGPIVRGSGVGFLIGILPGAAHIISTFVSYAMEKRLSRYPEKFGTGQIEGVAGPEAANNAATGGAMIPFLGLGIPSTAATATMMVALLIHGVKPGPLLMEQHPEVFWGLVGSMYIGNTMLLILNLPLVGLFVNLLRVPYHFLFPAILLICFVGVYSVNLSGTDLWIMAIFGVVGYGLRKLAFDPSPIVLALVLGPMMEQALRQALIMSRGEFGVFLSRPIAAGMLAAAALLLLFHLFEVLRRVRRRGDAKRSAGVPVEGQTSV
ncbi:MAG TPA: tripartite tricarboxylate transporter permease [Candidatus Tectomicrobia bacterium]|nr:tripartite tricarboxylate transporter permease [Candidatus Tectomicrobia bacterium]